MHGSSLTYHRFVFCAPRFCFHPRGLLFLCCSYTSSWLQECAHSIVVLQYAISVLSRIYSTSSTVLHHEGIACMEIDSRLQHEVSSFRCKEASLAARKENREFVPKMFSKVESMKPYSSDLLTSKTRLFFFLFSLL